MRRPSRLVPLALAPAATAILIVASCLDDTTGPATVPGVLALQPSFASGAAGLVDVDRARIVIERDPGNEIVVDSIHPIAPGEDEIDLTFEDIAITSPEDVFTLTLTLISPLGDTVFRFGPAPVQVFPPGVTPVPVQVALDYVGPGSEAAGVEFVTPDGSLFFGEAGQVMAQGVDDQGEPLPEAPVKYNALDPTLVAVLDDSTGQIQAQNQRGPARVEAELLTGQTDTLTIMVQPVPNALMVVLGDGQQGVPDQPLPLPVVLEVTAADGLGVQGVTVDVTTPDGGGFAPASGVTDADGQLSVVWTLGPAQGTQTGNAVVTAPANLQVAFTAEALPLEPVTTTWTNPLGGAWTDPANWDPRLPLAIDDAVIDLAGDYTVTLDVNTTVAGLSLGGTSGTQTLLVNGVTLTSDGAVTVGANGVLDLVDGIMTGMGTITSSGVIVSTGFAVSQITNPVAVTGPIDVASGSLSLQGGGSFSGSSTISSTANLDFSQGVFTLGDYIQSGGGIVSISAATVDVTGAATVENFVMVGGTLGGLGQLDVTTAFSWNGGTMTDGGTTVLGQGASGGISAGATPLLLTDGRRLENNGTVVWSGDVMGSNAPVLANLGTVIVQADAAFLWDQVSDRPTLDNQGVLNVVAGTFDVDVTLVHAAGALLEGFGTLALDGASVGAVDGSVFPGTDGAAGILTVGLGASDIVFGSTALLGIDVFGATPGVEHDQLVFTGSGSVTFDGTLQASLGISPAWLDQFTILTYPAQTGSFASTNLDPTMRVSFTATDGVLEQFAPPTATAIWEGSASSDWLDPANWNTGAEPTPTDNVFIPAGTPNDPTLAPEQTVSINDLTVDEGATLSIQDAATVNTTGNVDAGFTSVTGATLAMAGSDVTVRGAVPSLFVTGSVRVLDNVIANSITVDDGSFDVGGGVARVVGDFATVGLGTLVMTDPAATLITNGAFFGGGTTTDLLTAGTIQVTGPFLEANGSPDAFAPSGTHLVTFVGDGTSTQIVSFMNRSSFFQELEVASAAAVLFQSNVIVNGSVTVRESGTLTAGEAGEFTEIAGNLTTLDDGALATNADGATVQVAGDVTFGGRSTAGLLDVGTLVIGGSFTQSAASSLSSFAPGQFFQTQFSSTATQIVSFETPGVAESHFGILTVANAAGGISLQTAVTAVGELTTNLGGIGNLIRGNGNPLEVAGINASSVVFDNVPLTIVDGAFTTPFALDDATFQNMPVDQAQLTVLRSGNILDMGLSTGVVFTTAPDVQNGGVYIHADDTDPNDGNGLVINVFNPSPNPIDVETEISTANGAIINWDPA